jgi:uncharacterized membrane protein
MQINLNDHIKEVQDFPTKRIGLKKNKNKVKLEKIVKEYNEATKYEIWEGVRDNFIFGFLASTLVVFIATKTDLAVLIGYLTYYFFMGKIVNRPKYVTDLGKLIVFPIPSTLGAFAGYKLSYYFLQFLS